MKEKNRSIWTRKQSVWCIVGVVILGLLLNGAAQLMLADRVVYFDLADYKDRNTGTNPSELLIEYWQYNLHEVDQQVRKNGLTEDGALITPENTPDTYFKGGGAILVVRPAGRLTTGNAFLENTYPQLLKYREA